MKYRASYTVLKLLKTEPHFGVSVPLFLKNYFSPLIYFSPIKKDRPDTIHVRSGRSFFNLDYCIAAGVFMQVLINLFIMSFPFFGPQLILHDFTGGCFGQFSKFNFLRHFEPGYPFPAKFQNFLYGGTGTFF